MQISNVPLFQLINLKSSILTERTFQKKVLLSPQLSPGLHCHKRQHIYDILCILYIYIYKVYIAIKKQNQFLSFNITGSLRVSWSTDTHQECSNVSKRSLYQKVHIAVKNKPCVFQLCCATCFLKVLLS